MQKLGDVTKWLGVLSIIVMLIIIVRGPMSTLNDEPAKNLALIKKVANEIFPDKPIVAKLAIAQAILESNLAGRPSQLALKYNNLFGIKGTGTKGSVTFQTQEHDKKGTSSTIRAGFAANNSVEDSVIQYKKLLERGTKDKPDRYKKVLDASSFAEAATEIRLAGYATDIAYTRMLMQIYNQYLK